MDFEGKVIQFLGETSGTSKTGNPWKKKEWVVETFGQYPKKVKIQCMNARADALNLEPGRDYVLSVDLESREFNGKWYTDVNVFRAQDYQGHQNFGGQQPSYPGGGYQNPQPQQGFSNQPYPTQGFGGNNQGFATNEGDSDEDLPF
ncbi:MAG: DUF3127 domain-containing protein [Muribaculaceae bacterium]|nr:DUF3127 domain-containing protein [Muribaculaceae bacterium]